jgi:hypothetical protein
MTNENPIILFSSGPCISQEFKLEQAKFRPANKYTKSVSVLCWKNKLYLFINERANMIIQFLKNVGFHEMEFIKKFGINKYMKS